MELVLNLVGLSVVLAMVCLWLRWAPRAGRNWWIQPVALFALILILFPVISVTDDLIAAQNPAETDTLVRKDHVVCALRQVSPLIVALPSPSVADLPFGFLRSAAPGTITPLPIDPPALSPVENRPPPVA